MSFQPNALEIGLLRQSRLSVMPLTKAHFDTITKLGKFRSAGGR